MDLTSKQEGPKLGELIEATTGALAIGAVVAYVSGWVYHTYYFFYFGAGWLVDLIPFDTLLLRSWQPMVLIALILFARRLGLEGVAGRPLRFYTLSFSLFFLLLLRYLPKPVQSDMFNLVVVGLAILVLGFCVNEALNWFTFKPLAAMFEAKPRRVAAFAFMVLFLWPALLGEFSAMFASHDSLGTLPEVVLSDGSSSYRALYFDEHRVYCVSLREFATVRMPLRKAFGFPTIEKQSVTVITWEQVKALRGPRRAT